MNIFVSWAYVAKASETAAQLITKIQESQLEGAESVPETPPQVDVQALPEFTVRLPEWCALQRAPDWEAKLKELDSLNADLLCIRFVIPELGIAQNFSLAGRLPGSGKLLPAIAARAFLLNTFKDEWNYPLHDGKARRHRLTFVGLAGLHQFLKRWLLACGVFNDSSLPITVLNTPAVELDNDEVLREFLTACRLHAGADEEMIKYDHLLQNWLGTAVSADRDSYINVTVAHHLGLNSLKSEK